MIGTPTSMINCDGNHGRCPKLIEFYLEKTYTGAVARWSDANLDDFLKKLGWKVSEGQHFCPGCAYSS